MSSDAPYLTSDLPGIGGRLKVRHEDFVVDEIPLYQASGQGTHVYVQVEKRAIATLSVIDKMAQALGIPRRNIGFAGLKDARAVTRQWLSIEHIDIDKIKALDFSNFKVIAIERHTNKIKTGHLRGNIFEINIREFDKDIKLEEAVSRVENIMAVLGRRGVPNYYGQQRFGKRDDGQVLGAAIIREDWDEFIAELLARPLEIENETIQKARRAFEEGDLKKALQTWPMSFLAQRQALRYLLERKPGDNEGAFNAIDHKYRRFCVSSFQSAMFNKVLARRVQDIDKLYRGDIARKHDNGACFMVFEPEVEQHRCDNFDISPTGPMFGYEMLWPGEEAARLENEVLCETNLALDDFKVGYGKRVAQGTRRSLRFQPKSIEVKGIKDETGHYVKLRFELDSGSYATTLAREVMKNETESLGLIDME
ncbi:MAG: tRNA pseudouridine(13) synthase TruD [Sedimentisphaerales bacterium]|nr:tRNA pseudouridine(13) synthase TruD [Sedimentisphaerales bacterium]MBN2842609.1 tRNA pseudouridine(13) synthase TruD [Sedimentisphaerales bacterium]